MHTERIVRHPSGVITSASAPVVSTVDTPTETAPIRPNERHFEAEITLPSITRGTLSDVHPRTSRDGLATPPRITRDDIADSLSRRAAKLREESEV
jgi:hypothetical protein